MFRMWVYVGTAALIAVAAFALGQLAAGAGVIFAAAATGLWTSWAAHRARRLQAGDGCR